MESAIETVAVVGLDAFSVQVALPLASCAVCPFDHHGGADQAERGGRLRGLLQRDQSGKRVVRLELLLDLGELDQLLGELVGVERIERVLVLQLRGEQLQEGGEIAGDGAVVDRAGDGGGRWCRCLRWSEECCS